MNEPWWRKSVVYQIYPKSFCDTTGDGIGDLEGVIQKLPYLKELGVDVIWLTPIYTSPQRDNGYDISDYFAIDERYGTMEDFERLLTECHQRGLRVILDIVVNHTSTEHPWFQQARQSVDNEYRNYYIWKTTHEDETKPNNWLSKFGGSAWEYSQETGQYYLHLFDVAQADLNWENEKLRKEIQNMMHFWLQKGVEGFRLDVINLISKHQEFSNDDGSIPPGDGRRYYTDGPRIHEYLQELNREVFSRYDMMTVGEMSSTTVEECIQYTSPSRRELDMVFNFHHLKTDYVNGDKWTLGNLDLVALKQIFSKWQTRMNEGHGWNALFWCNHDQPRIVSRFGNDTKYRKESAKMLATTIHMMQGTPYIYQGEEIGMTNPNFTHIEEYRDVESLNMYEILRGAGKSEREILEILQSKSRDNSRTPVPWSSEKNGGFTTGTPWIDLASNYKTINVEESLHDPDSVFYHYQKLIQLRKSLDLISTGDFKLLLEDHPQIFAYVRRGASEKLLVISNFNGEPVYFHFPKDEDVSGYHTDILISNYDDTPTDLKTLTLRPYESVVYHLKKE